MAYTQEEDGGQDEASDIEKVDDPGEILQRKAAELDGHETVELDDTERPAEISGNERPAEIVRIEIPVEMPA